MKTAQLGIELGTRHLRICTRDKEEFLNKINALIEGYGNLINTYTIVVCIEADEPIKLLSFIKSEVPDVEIWKELK